MVFNINYIPTESWLDGEQGHSQDHFCTLPRSCYMYAHKASSHLQSQSNDS